MLSLSSVKDVDLSQIYSESVAAKIVQVAQRGLKQSAPLPSYPHTVPQIGPDAGRYEEREADFWTCGFFPGCIYALLERSIRYPQAIDVPEHVRPQIQDQLLKLGRHYGVAINQMSGRTDTHDMGFIVQPALQKDWELTGNKESLQSVVNAAYALASRYDDRVKAIRSWDVAINDRYSITDMSKNFLVIIDSMCSKSSSTPSLPLPNSPIHYRSRPPLLRRPHPKRPKANRHRNPTRRLHHPRNPATRLLLLPPRKLRPADRSTTSQDDESGLERRFDVESRPSLGDNGVRADVFVDEGYQVSGDGDSMRRVFLAQIERRRREVAPPHGPVLGFRRATG